MSKMFSLKKPPREKVEELTEKLREYPELEPRMTTIWPLSQERRIALEMIRTEEINEGAVFNLLKSDDFIERRAGLYILSTSNVRETSKDFQEKVLLLSEKLVQDKIEWSREKALEILGQIGAKALPFLKELILGEKYRDWRSKIVGREGLVIETLGQIGSEAVPLLKELAQSKHWWISKPAEKILNKKIQPPEETTPTKTRRTKEKGYTWLLASRKPLFATPYTKELAMNLLKLSKVENAFRKKVGDALVGIVILGSTAKGYFGTLSDIDYVVVGRNPELLEEFKKLASSSLNLCSLEHKVSLEGDRIVGYTNALFGGLFFGDRQKLLGYQKKVLEQINERVWDRIREITMFREMGLYFKAEQRLNVDKKELERIRQAVALLRTPPPYEKALEIINQRYSKSKKV